MTVVKRDTNLVSEETEDRTSRVDEKKDTRKYEALDSEDEGKIEVVAKTNYDRTDKEDVKFKSDIKMKIKVTAKDDAKADVKIKDDVKIEAGVKINDDAKNKDDAKIKVEAKPGLETTTGVDTSKSKCNDDSKSTAGRQKSIVFPVKLSTHRLVSLSGVGDMSKGAAARKTAAMAATATAVATGTDKVRKLEDRGTPAKKGVGTSGVGKGERQTRGLGEGVRKGVAMTSGRVGRGGGDAAGRASSSESLEGATDGGAAAPRKQSFVSSITLAVNNDGHQVAPAVAQPHPHNGVLKKVPGTNVYEMTLSLSEASEKSAAKASSGSGHQGAAAAASRTGLRKSGGQVASLASSFLGKSNAVQTRSQSTPFVSTLLKTKSPVTNYQKTKAAAAAAAAAAASATSASPAAARKGSTTPATPKTGSVRGQVNGMSAGVQTPPTATATAAAARTKTNGAVTPRIAKATLKINGDAAAAAAAAAGAKPLKSPGAGVGARRPLSGIAKLKSTGATPTKMKPPSPTDRSPKLSGVAKMGSFERIEKAAGAPEKTEKSVFASEKTEKSVFASEKTEKSVFASEKTEKSVFASEKTEKSVFASEKTEKSVFASEKTEKSVFVVEKSVPETETSAADDVATERSSTATKAERVAGVAGEDRSSATDVGRPSKDVVTQRCEDPPVFSRSLEDQTVVDGDAVEFVVEISGEWKKWRKWVSMAGRGRLSYDNDFAKNDIAISAFSITI